MSGPLSGFRSRLESSPNYRRWVLIVALTGMFATTFPVTILVVSLGDIARDFGTSETVLAWVISAPMLASAVVLPVLGKMGDLYGQRRVFILGFAGATFAAILTALAWSPGALIGFRTLALVIGAATQPTSMALVISVYPPMERVKALGWWSLVAAGGPSVGLVIGGPLIDWVGWRPLFLIQAVLGFTVLAASWFVLKEVRKHERVRFDVAGSAALTVGAGALLVLLSQGPDWGWTHPALLVCAALSPLGLAWFYRVEGKAAAPLLPLRYFQRRNFTATQISALFMGAAYMGGFVLSPLLTRFVLGYSLSQTALMMMLRPLTFSLSSPVGARLAMRIGERTNAVIGTAMMTGAMVAFAFSALQASVAFVVAGLVLQGVGNGVARPSLTASLTNAVDEKDIGIASASNRMLHQIGASFGIAVLTAIYGGSRLGSSFARAHLVGAVFGVLALIAAAFVISERRHPLRSEEHAEQELEVAPTG
ncbi:MAG TPA: MFS transporter [Actinomycetota bacterium]|jgi:EmrB/QacA subfamily drug resistance transporter|nr:MFS transporter [Actinomycetota bacterium]